MFFKVIDKFFLQIKQIISLIVMLLIVLATLTFLFWILNSAKVALPSFLNDFLWKVCDFFAVFYLNSSKYRELHELLPVITSVILGVIAYLANCLMVFLECNHKKYHEAVYHYKKFVQKNVNKQLENDFHTELRKSTLLFVKIKVCAEQKTSYLTAATDEIHDTDTISKNIEERILNSISHSYIKQKGKTNDSIYFLLNNFDNTKAFFSEVVENATKIINENLKPKLDIAFYCGCELLNDSSELQAQDKCISKMFGMKLANKIIVTNKFKVFYENLYKDMFDFSVQGEYNLNDSDVEVVNTMLYILQRKS